MKTKNPTKPKQCHSCKATYFTGGYKFCEPCNPKAKPKLRPPFNGCDMCGKQFQRVSRERVCSEECRKQRDATYRVKHLEKHDKVPKTETRNCKCCGSKFTVFEKLRKDYCSEKCKNKLRPPISEERRAVKNKRSREKYKNDPVWREKHIRQAKEGVYRAMKTPEGRAQTRLRRNMRKALQRLTQNSEATSLTLAEIGYTPAELKHRLEQTMPAGATWDDFMSGDLHIDHIRPVASFDLLDESQLIECYSLGNLQLLWAYDNISKGSHYEGKRHLVKKSALPDWLVPRPKDIYPEWMLK